MTKLQKLISIGSPAIAPNRISKDRLAAAFGSVGGSMLVRLLEEKNGFYAFEGALHVLPDHGMNDERGVFDWNESGLWRHAYGGMADSGLFFAEDVFGNQFSLGVDGGVSAFDSETGDYERIASDLEEWAQLVLAEYDMWTGFPLAHEWQARNGSIPVGKRLLPKQPFVLGGEYSVENLYAAAAVKGMRFRGTMAVQIRDVPDGSTVKVKIVE